ncbi:MAG: hypothetical protein KDA96_20630, partial [Planctomycetaceae bacterium]|nr:hypothetical protein [Planctomycetaceae bacterium]
GAPAGDILTEEFGAVAATGMGGMGFGSLGFGPSGMSPGNEDESGGGQAPAEDDRYVDDKDELPYRTRAFTLHVKVLASDIPVFMTSLTNSDYPVEIVRADLFFGGPTSGSAGGMGMGDAEGGYGGGMGGGIGDMGADPYGSTDGYGAAPGGYGGAPSGYGDAEGGGDPSGGYGDGYGSPYGGGDGYGDGYGGAGGEMLSEKETAQKRLQVALANPGLVDLRIGGLLTIYRTPEEETAEKEAENTTESDASAVDPAEMSEGEGTSDDPAASPGEPGATDGAPTENGAAPAEPNAKGNNPDDPAAPPADPAVPGEPGTAPAANPEGSGTAPQSPSGAAEPSASEPQPAPTE